MAQGLTTKEIDSLTTSLHYCKVEELKEIAEQLGVLPQGKKAYLIASIMHFITTRKQLSPEKIPVSSEWAYPNFLKEFKEKYPHIPREVALAAWEGLRLKHKKNVLTLIKKYNKNNQ
jgi:hypothetical protein